MATQKSTVSVEPQKKYAKWPDAALLVGLALLPCLFFWRLLTPHPADRMHIVAGDFTEQYFPLRAFTAQAWVQPHIPLWNPYLFGGQPALADIQAGALYPPHVIEALILGWGGPLWGREIGFPLWALEGQVIVHFSLAAVGSYLFGRHLGRRGGVSLRRARFDGVITSLVFTYSGYLTGFPVQQMTILAASAWLPWVMWAVSNIGMRNEKVEVRRGLRVIGWGGLALAMAILAGHPQTGLYIFYLSLAYTIFRAVWAWRNGAAGLSGENQQLSGGGMKWLSRLLPSFFAPWPGLFHCLAVHLLVWFGLVLLGVAIAAAQALPTLEFIAHSLRADLSYQAVSAGLPLTELISVLYPGFFGGSPEYVGLVGLVLLAAALVLGRPRREIFFWAGAGLVGLVLAFGGSTFLYPLFYLLAPGFAAVRQQERAFLVYSFSAAVLAGYGAIALTGPFSKLARRRYACFERGLRIVVVVALGLTAFYIYGSAAVTARGDEVNLFYGVLRYHLFGLMMLGGLVAWLALRPRRWQRRAWAMALLALWLIFNLFTVNWRFNLEKRAGVEPFAPNGVVQFLQAKLSPGPSNPTWGRIVSGGLLPGGHNAASVYHLEDLTGNTPLQLAGVDTFFRQMPAWRLWQLLNVRYVVARQDIAGDGLRLVFEEGEDKVFEMGDPFPRAWPVSQVEVIPEIEQATARLADDDFDLRQAAVLAEPLGVSLAQAAATVTVVDSVAGYLKVEVEALGRQLLVVSQIYYPGWQAEVDHQPAELWRVNVVQQGVIVPAGRHTVELFFRPVSFWWGGIISLMGLALGLWFILPGALSGTMRNP
ncbi:MAG: hypothetical protein JW953_23690 [Anaerolineae bacterium]|nr:hypothetical protein [Anaerolineae bacterium]